MRPNQRIPYRPAGGQRGQRVGLARALSKLGYCSRSQARTLVQSGRVRLDGVVERNPEKWVTLQQARIEVEGQPISACSKVYLMLNKPRGLVTTLRDERGRPTVFNCLSEKGLPRVGPVGRLDKASEGLLLFTNDTDWAARITGPESHLEKTYHVQVDCRADEILAQKMRDGVSAEGDFLVAKRVTVLRHGTQNSWLEIVLDEGKNRHIRRLLAAFGVNVLRLMRVAIGPLQLGDLAKGAHRRLTLQEVTALAKP